MLTYLQKAQQLARSGRREDAIAELRRAVVESPSARDARLMLARLANEMGAFALGEEHARQLTIADAGDSEAWCALGFSLSSLGRPRQASAALQRAVQLAPRYGVAHRNLAAVYCDQEKSEAAIAAAEESKRQGISPVVADRIIARALVQLDRLDEAERHLRDVLAASPADAQALRILGQLRHLRGDADPLAELRVAARALGAPPSVRMTLADLLRQRGELVESEAELQPMLVQYGPVPEIHRALAIVMQERGDWPRAFRHARTAFEASPDSPAIAESFVISCIGNGAAAEALPVVERMRASFPRDQRWITHRIDIARLCQQGGFDSWYAPGLVTQTFELNDDVLLDSVRELLEAKHRHRGHPLEQSIRRGTQTARNLLVDPEPPLQQVFAWFEERMREYVSRLAAQLADSTHASHPVLARANAAPRPVGCWSVRLGHGGFHVNHIHPEGWLSSAFYLQVPEEAADTSLKHGWLKFGEPGQATSVLPPTGFVQPRPGRLVLFPSYLWHGTTALTRDATRLTVAFDALPESEIA